ncbi:MAG: hypothetical protein CVT92_06825 [Bacteroidetes bacterium HGW-Bacteroidetes-1]|jgi:tetratricopeptide (TPR) repeat protein|nr:MAG: hypothetical protein CVT92_06825 [Bacteroidetes bacterium HGW-Bacteroidetes-1]
MKKMMKTFLTIFSLILLSTAAHTTEPQQQFELGNNYYNQAIYDSALFHYHKILDTGLESDVLYYNMANAYFKLKEVPYSILYYEKALKINPTDEDIAHNLSIANAMIVDKIEVLPQLFFKVWWNTFYKLLPADTWAWISVLVFILTLLAIYLYLTSFNILVRKLAFFSGLVLIFSSLASFGLASQKYYYTQQTNEAIIFAPTITIKSSPVASSVDLFVLHEGTKVTLLDHTNGWQKIKIANGSIGWLPEDVLKGI